MTDAETIFDRFRGRPVLVDANLLLLYLIGTFQRARVETFKRTSEFTLEQFDILFRLLRGFPVIVTTPHILTEVSGLANSLPDRIKPEWCDHFAQQVGTFREISRPATIVMQESCFSPFGLTDAAIQNAAPDILVLTQDHRLSDVLSRQGITTLGFRDLADSI
jgi:hypothetical protein